MDQRELAWLPSVIEQRRERRGEIAMLGRKMFLEVVLFRPEDEREGGAQPPAMTPGAEPGLAPSAVPSV